MKKYFLLLSICLSINAFQPPTVTATGEVRIKPAAQKRLFQEAESIPNDEQLFNYLQGRLGEIGAQTFIDVLRRPKKIYVRNETYFKDFFWISNDGHDLRDLAHDVIELLNSKRIYAKLKSDEKFIMYLTKYLADRYSGITLLGAAIPFESLPATPQFVANQIKNDKNSEIAWCKELPLLERWLDTAKEPTINDPFYEKGILLLINALPKNHSLLKKENSCVKDILFHAIIIDNYKKIVEILLEKGVNANWKYSRDETLLHWAAFNANESLVQKLLNAGAEVNVLNIHNETPLDFAKNSSHANKNQIIKMLMDKGAQSGKL